MSDDQPVEPRAFFTLGQLMASVVGSPGAGESELVPACIRAAYVLGAQPLYGLPPPWADIPSEVRERVVAALEAADCARAVRRLREAT